MRYVWLVLLGIFVGWLAGVLTKGRGFGLIGDLFVGVIGALVGGFIFSLLGLRAYSLVGWGIMAVIGAVIFLALLRLIKRV